jgi:hypothetical protein
MNIGYFRNYKIKDGLTLQEKEIFYDKYNWWEKNSIWFVLGGLLSIFLIFSILSLHTSVTIRLIIVLIFLVIGVALTLLLEVSSYYCLSDYAMVGVALGRLVDYHQNTDAEFLNEKTITESRVHRINISYFLPDCNAEMTDERIMLEKFNKEIKYFYRYSLLSDKSTFLDIKDNLRAISDDLKNPSIAKFINDFPILREKYRSLQGHFRFLDLERTLWEYESEKSKNWNIKEKIKYIFSFIQEYIKAFYFLVIIFVLICFTIFDPHGLAMLITEIVKALSGL